MFALITAMSSAFVLPAATPRTAELQRRCPVPVAIGGFEMPKMPELPNPFGGGGEPLRLFPSDVGPGIGGSYCRALEVLVRRQTLASAQCERVP